MFISPTPSSSSHSPHSPSECRSKVRFVFSFQSEKHFGGYNESLNIITLIYPNNIESQEEVEKGGDRNLCLDWFISEN